MGIYIPNEPMPKNCAFCPVEHYDCPLLGEDEKGWGIDVTAYFDGNERHPDCPLVEVKPHGRLIDADALLAKFEVDESSCDAHGQDFTFSFIRGEAYCTEWYYPQQRLMDAPTIIESDGEDG